MNIKKQGHSTPPFFKWKAQYSTFCYNMEMKYAKNIDIKYYFIL